MTENAVWWQVSFENDMKASGFMKGRQFLDHVSDSAVQTVFRVQV